MTVAAGLLLFALPDDQFAAEAHVLLLRRSSRVSEPGVWSNPGGVVEPGETAFEAAVRETVEEIGVRPNFVLFKGNPGPAVVQYGPTTYHLFCGKVTAAEARRISREARLNWESDAIGWFDAHAEPWVRPGAPGPMHPGFLAVWSRIYGATVARYA